MGLHFAAGNTLMTVQFRPIRFALVCTLCPLLFCLDTFGQGIQTSDISKLPQFEVASVKPNRSGADPWRFDTPPGRVVATNVSLHSLIQYAYSIFGSDSDGRIVAPAWIKSARFDIDAKTSADTSSSQAMAMLRRLLAERFGMQAHYDMQPRRVYALVMSRTDQRLGPQLKSNPIDCAEYIAVTQAAHARGEGPPLDPNHPICGQRGEPGHVVANGQTMAQLATTLSGLGRPVVDETGLGAQRFDYELRWAPITGPSPDSSTNGGPSIFTALDEQLGVKLVPKDGLLEVLVIVHIEQPSDN